MKKLFLFSLFALSGVVGMHAYAVTPDTSDTSKPSDVNKQQAASPPVDTWYSQPKAVVRVLNKLESSVTTLTIPVGGSAQYQTLTIAVKHCVVRPTVASPDSAAFVTITDSKLSTNPFSAWIFVAEPGASVFEHPLYNVSLSGCAGEISNKPLEVKSTTTNTEQKGLENQNDLEQSLEHSIQSQH